MKSNGVQWTCLADGPYDGFDLVYIPLLPNALEETEYSKLVRKILDTGASVALSLKVEEEVGDGRIVDRESTYREVWSFPDVESVIAQFDDHYSDPDHKIGVFLFTPKFAAVNISVYAIGLNEEKYIARCINSCKDADSFTYIDTGSSDRTVEIAREHGASVHSIKVSPWRFDDARNAALALVPATADICISLDVDEVLTPGWRKIIEGMWIKGRTTRIRCMFDWGDGIVYPYQKIHARHGYRWLHPCHEYLSPDKRQVERLAITGDVLIKHLPDQTKPRGQYRGLLELAAHENPHSTHAAIYLGREYVTDGESREGITHLKKYLDLPDAVWNKERAYAYLLLSQAYEQLSDNKCRYGMILRAVAEAPEMRETHYELARYYSDHSMWEECKGAAAAGLRITNREYYYMVNPIVWQGALEAFHSKTVT